MTPWQRHALRDRALDCAYNINDLDASRRRIERLTRPLTDAEWAAVVATCERGVIHVSEVMREYVETAWPTEGEVEGWEP